MQRGLQLLFLLLTASALGHSPEWKLGLQHNDLNQTLAASYRYDPYGNTTYSSGSLAAANVYRFSSKEVHVNSGLYSYGYRFYSPNWQRWLNRDPLASGGPLPMGLRLPARLKRQPWEAFEGPNLYTYVHNNPVNAVDANGLWTFGFGLGGLFELIGAFGYDVGIYVGRNPDNGKWSFGVEAGPSVGAGGPGDMGIGGFVQWTDAKRVCDLKGFSFKVGGSVGPRPIQPWAVTADGLVGLDSSGISYKGVEIGLAASEGFPVGGHALVNWTWGWDTDSGWK